jgi:hypothetical protein
MMILDSFGSFLAIYSAPKVLTALPAIEARIANKAPSAPKAHIVPEAQ